MPWKSWNVVLRRAFNERVPDAPSGTRTGWVDAANERVYKMTNVGRDPGREAIGADHAEAWRVRDFADRAAARS